MTLFSIKNRNFDKKRIFLRLDLNVPFALDGSIQDEFRLQACLPTLTYLQKSGAQLLLITHLGNPKPEHPDATLSTKQLIPWFAKQNFNVVYAAALHQAQEYVNQKQSIVLLENIRFFHGEKELNQTFAQQLATLADVYVTDAFGALHRSDTSIALTPLQFAQTNRSIGFLIEQEMRHLDRLKNSPVQPFVLVLGGSKLADKLPLIQSFLKLPIPQRPEHIIIGGALALPFLQAQGINTGIAARDQQNINHALNTLQTAQKQQVMVHLPTDVAVIDGSLGSWATIVQVNNIKSPCQVVDIGPTTIARFNNIINTAQTIFANGTMGIYEYAAYQNGTHAVIQAITQSSAYSVIGGGDCAAAAHQYGLAKKITFISTGGGATLHYLSSQNPLHDMPGLHALIA